MKHCGGLIVALAFGTSPLFPQLTITPANVTLRAAGIQQFSASPGTCYSWTASIGFINLSGVYQAPFNIPVPQMVTVSCSNSQGQGSTTLTLAASSTAVAGLSWNRGGIYGGTVLIEAPANPLYAASGQLLLDLDLNYFQLIPSSHRPGQTMLSLNPSNLPPGPPGPAGPTGPPGVNCTFPNGCPGLGTTTNPDGSLALFLNTAYVMSRALDVQNVDHWCADHSGTPAYVCGTPSPAAWQLPGGASGYIAGQWVLFTPSVSSSGPASLNVNNQGITSIKLVDGTTDPGTQLKQGQPYLLTQDGTVWRMSQGDSYAQIPMTVAISQCSGSGVGWDCSGLYRVMTPNLTLIGVLDANIPTTGVTWNPVNP